MINPFYQDWDLNQIGALIKVKQQVDFDEVVSVIDDFSKLKVLVVGEPIVDTYVFVETCGLSSKSPTVSAKTINQEDYAGGSLAIANHLSALGCDVSLLITHGGEHYFEQILHEKMNPAIKLQCQVLKGIPTPRKSRFITPFRAQRLFELMDINDLQWKENDPEIFNEHLYKMSQDKDVVIVADFGHGLFEGDVLRSLSRIKNFMALNVQTNSANYGFNQFTKHSRYDYLSLDERECRVAMSDRLTPKNELIRATMNHVVKRTSSITLGLEGSVYYDADIKDHSCPVFFKDVVDTTGAGDAYFAITSLLVKQKVKPVLVPFLGNCFAGLKTRILGNKKAVSKEELVNLLQIMWKS